MPCERALIGSYVSVEKGVSSGSSYIFCRVNEVQQEEAKLVPSGGSSDYWFVYDVALYADTVIIGSPYGLVTAEDVPYALILWYVSKTIYLS